MSKKTRAVAVILAAIMVLSLITGMILPYL